MLLKNMKLLCAAMFAAGAMALNAAVPAMSLEYFYDKDGTIIGRSVNGEKFTYSYDKKGQLLSVKSLDGKVAEAYAYDPAGNILSKTIDGKTTYFKYDKANQLVSSTDAKGKVTNYEYDAAGRLVKEGDKEYKYSYLDKIVAVTENGKETASFDYYVNGQIASATQGGMQETFVWDGLALIQRNSTNYINEPAVTGGNPILADNKVLFNDMLGTTLGVKDSKGNVSQTAMTSFGDSRSGSASHEEFFTGKPYIGELGHAFLFRNYRADLGKWQTADPLGYPDGWNQLAYCNNHVIFSIDLYGFAEVNLVLVSDTTVSGDADKFRSAGYTVIENVTSLADAVIKIIDYAQTSGDTIKNLAVSGHGDGAGVQASQGPINMENLTPSQATAVKNTLASGATYTSFGCGSGGDADGLQSIANILGVSTFGFTGPVNAGPNPNYENPTFLDEVLAWITGGPTPTSPGWHWVVVRPE